MRSKDRALYAPARLHSHAPWRRSGSRPQMSVCDAGVAFISAHGCPRGPVTTLLGPGSIDIEGASCES